MRNPRLDALTACVREKINEGVLIVVYGWLASNHNKTTLALEQTKLVRFLERSSRINGASKQAFVLMTKFVSHADQGQLTKTAGECYPHVLTPGQIKTMLEKCKAQILSRVQKHVEERIADVPQENAVPDLNELEKILIETEVTMDQYDRLAEIFTESASTHSEDYVSVHEMSRILNVVNDSLSEGDEELPDKRALIRENWIVPIKAEGKKKTGWYKAGEKLLKRIQRGRKEEPADPIEKGEWLVERKEHFNKELEEAKKHRDLVVKEQDRLVEEKAKMVERAKVAEELLDTLRGKLKEL